MTGRARAVRSRPPGPATPLETAVLVLGAALVAGATWVWLAGQVAGWLAGGRWPPIPVTSGLTILGRVPGHLGDLRAAWPVAARAFLPASALLDASAAGLLVPFAAVGLGARRWKRRPPPARPHPRRRGARWAGGRDVRSLRAGRLAWRRGGGPRLALGYRDGAMVGGRRLIATESRHSVLVIGPTQSGKTTGLAVPAILEWPGPVIATSVKDDLAAATISWRSRHGPRWVFDPTRSTGLGDGAAWTPLGACDGWSAAQRVAAWLVDATPARSGMADAAFWYAAAAKQLAPLLLAARAGGLAMADVVRWTNTGDFSEPAGLLQLAGETEAATALAACERRDERILSSVGTTLETVLAPFEDPVVAASTGRCDIDVDELLDRRGTLYLCGPSHEQARVQGLFAALVSAAVAAAIRKVGDTRQPLDPPLLLVLDEVANVAPIRDLDGLASTGAGLGVQLVTVCQDLAQLGARYGPERARTIANNHRAKVLLSGVSDLVTLDLISGLAGEEAVCEESVTHDIRDGGRTRSSAVAFRRLAPTDELRRIPPGRGVLVYGHLPPVRLRLRPWYADRRLRARADRRLRARAGAGA